LFIDLAIGLGLSLVAADDFDDILRVRLQLRTAGLLSLRTPARRRLPKWQQSTSGS
jgi:hypothetical protein